MEKIIVMNDEEYRGVPEEWKETEAYKSIIGGMNKMQARAKAFREGMKNPNYEKPIEIQEVLDEINEFLTSKGYEFVVEDKTNFFMVYVATKEDLPFKIIEVKTYWQSFGSCPVHFYANKNNLPNYEYSYNCPAINYDTTRYEMGSRKARTIWKRDFNKIPLVQVSYWCESDKVENMYNRAVKYLEESCTK